MEINASVISTLFCYVVHGTLKFAEGGSATEGGTGSGTEGHWQCRSRQGYRGALAVQVQGVLQMGTASAGRGSAPEGHWECSSRQCYIGALGVQVQGMLHRSTGIAGPGSAT